MLQRQSSIKSENEAKMDTNGFLHFALKYDKELEGLVVKVKNFSTTTILPKLRGFSLWYRRSIFLLQSLKSQGS